MLDLPAKSEGRTDAPALADAFVTHASPPGPAAPFDGLGLAGRVLAVTIGFVLLAMGLFYVTRLTAHREMLLRAKIAATQTTVEAFGLGGATPPSHDLAQKILNSVEVKWIAVTTPTGRREFTLSGGV